MTYIRAFANWQILLVVIVRATKNTARAIGELHVMKNTARYKKYCAMGNTSRAATRDR